MLETDERASTRTALLSGFGLTKRYGHVHALDDVDIELRGGEVLALVGDNGAGKSTLMKILAGAVTADSGELRLDHRKVEFGTPADARRCGIAAVFQDLALVESLDVATNVFLGDLPTRRGLVDRRRMDRETAELLSEIGPAVRSPRTPVGLLPGGHRQVIAVARAIRGDAQILVMDEPTAALGFTEKGQVTDLIRRLRDQGRAIAVVSHDLELVFSVADRIQVLRLGRTAGVLEAAEADRDQLIGLITGAGE